MNNLDIVQQAVTLTRQAGADEAEAFLQHSHVLTIEVESGRVETIKEAEEQTLAVRAIVGGRMGLSYTSDLTLAGLRDLAAQAVAIARVADADEYVGLPDPPAGWPTVNGYDPEMATHSREEKIDRALAIEQAARAYDPRVVLTRKVTYQERGQREAIANSRGLLAEQEGNGCGGFAMVVARQANEQQIGAGSDLKRRYAAFDPAKVGIEAAEHAVALLGATSASTQRATLLLEPKMTAAFLGIIANLVRADNVQKNKSLLAGKVGQRVAASGVTIIDDGAHPDAPLVRAWDDEGVPSQRTLVISDGILQGYLHSTYTARKAHTRSTGNASRSSYKSLPEVASSNFVLLPGQETAATLQASISRGLLVKNLMNLHTANPISGEFSFGASGLWIEGGKVTGPVRGITIAGNLTELLLNIRAVGNDLVWSGMMGVSVGAPSVVIENISIAGR